MILRNTLLTFLLALSAFANPLYAAVDNFEEDPYVILCGEADRAIEAGNYEEAAARIIDAMAVKPSSPTNLMLLSNLGMVYSYLGRDSLAVATLDEALRREPKMTMAKANRAKVLLKLGRDKEAFADFGDVIDADSINADARYYHGMMALYGGDMKTAETDFKILEKRRPGSVETCAALSALYSMTGRDREAIPYFKELLIYEPAPEYYAGLAGCYLATGELSEAGATINEGMKLYPDDAELYYYRAWLNRDRFLMDDARADADKAMKLGASPARVQSLFK